MGDTGPGGLQAAHGRVGSGGPADRNEGDRGHWHPAALVPHLEALQAAAGANPQAFQKALAGCAEVLIAAGLENISPPRTVGELGKWNDIYRKASGLDGNRSGGDFKFVRPLRSLRRGPVVEVEEIPDDPLDGFEI